MILPESGASPGSVGERGHRASSTNGRTLVFKECSGASSLETETIEPVATLEAILVWIYSGDDVRIAVYRDFGLSNIGSCNASGPASPPLETGNHGPEKPGYTA